MSVNVNHSNLYVNKIFAEQEQGALDDRTGGWQAQRWTRSQVEAMLIISMIMVMMMMDTILIVMLIVSIVELNVKWQEMSLK